MELPTDYKKKIYIADDHQLFIDGLRLLFARHPRFEVTGYGHDGNAMIEFFKANPVDIIITDIDMPVLDGISATEHIKQQYPDVKIIAVSMINDYGSVHKMLQAGADGYVLKNANAGELIKAIEFALNGEVYINKEIADILTKGSMFNRSAEGKRITAIREELTQREKEILSLVTKGYSNQEIADELYISINTVKTHRSNILFKCDVKNTASLIRFIVENNLLSG
ncbi:MAG: response regulator transcription factor [Chitinophagaceae bacterium]|nr:response regulator transcription factor [Chitinophagaceae bacterium]